MVIKIGFIAITIEARLAVTVFRPEKKEEIICKHSCHTEKYDRQYLVLFQPGDFAFHPYRDKDQKNGCNGEPQERGTERANVLRDDPRGYKGSTPEDGRQ